MLFLFSITWGAVSGWWVLPCLFAGLLYAWLLYRKPTLLNHPYRTGLFACRAIAVSLIGLLLVSPLFKSITYRPKKPLILLVQDNSSSINLFHPSSFRPRAFVKQLAALQQQLGNDYEVRLHHFDQKLNSNLSEKFTGKQTNISNALQQLGEQYANQNIGGVVLATDGIYNTGANPEEAAQHLKVPVYSIALGDTTLRRDARIANVNYNHTVSLGNDFIIEVQAEAGQCKGQSLRITINEDDHTVYTKSLPVTTDDYHKILPVKLNASRKGIHRYTIMIGHLPNEATYANNTKTIYIETLDTRQKILLAYNSPHPDISVIKQAIEQNKNYEVKAVAAEQLHTIKAADYSLIILHQLTLSNNAILQQSFGDNRVPVWYFLGTQSNLSAFSSEQQLLQLGSAPQNFQEAFAILTDDFTAFTVTDSTRKKIGILPPLLVPFGSYHGAVGAAVLFKQKIGNISSGYPLLLFGKADNRSVGVLAGEGVWRWQLAEYAAYGNHHAVEEIINQSVQYLTANANRQRFGVYPANTVFEEGDEAILNAELYNEAFELVNTPEAAITLKNNSGKIYSYQFSRTGQSYQLNAAGLPAGEYTYSAATRLGNTPFTATGKFMVQASTRESLQSTADHNLLRRIARQSSGVMLLPSQLNRLADLIKKNDNIKTIEYSDQHYAEAIDLKWLLGLIVLLLSVEWVLRKREGEM